MTVKKVNSGLMEFNEDLQVLVVVDEDGEVQKAVTIDEDGDETSFAGITPTGKINITQNGTNIDVAQYAKADVAVPQPAGKINITENGTDIDVAQYALADVAVEGGIPGLTEIPHSQLRVAGESLDPQAPATLKIMGLTYAALIANSVTYYFQLTSSDAATLDITIPDNGLYFINAKSQEGSDYYVQATALETLGDGSLVTTHMVADTTSNGDTGTDNITFEFGLV